MGTALMWSIWEKGLYPEFEESSNAIAEVLIEAGANLGLECWRSWKDKKRRTALIWAIEFGQARIECLIRTGLQRAAADVVSLNHEVHQHAADRELFTGTAKVPDRGSRGEPGKSQLRTLTQMGFCEDAAYAALIAHENDVEKAAEALLEYQQHEQHDQHDRPQCQQSLGQTGVVADERGGAI